MNALLPLHAMAEPALRAQQITAGYGPSHVLRDLSLDIAVGRLTALVGPNGSGKSTLLAAMARLLPLRAGQVMLDGLDLRGKPSREVARELAVLPQSPIVPEGVSVLDLVSRGRYPHQSWRSRWSDADAHAVETALRLTGTAELSARPVTDLSGGQRQRVWIAMALAQETGILLLDEPTSALDPHYQEEILSLLRRLARGDDHAERIGAGRTVVVVLHDLNLAAGHADDMVFLKEGRVVASGATEAVCTAGVIEEVFGLPVHVLSHPETRRPIFAPRRLGR